MFEKCLMPSHLKITSSKTLHQMKAPEISSISSNNCCCCANMYIQKHTNYLSIITFEFKMFAFLTASTPQDCCHKYIPHLPIPSYHLGSFLNPCYVGSLHFEGTTHFCLMILCFCLWHEQQKTCHHKLATPYWTDIIFPSSTGPNFVYYLKCMLVIV